MTERDDDTSDNGEDLEIIDETSSSGSSTEASQTDKVSTLEAEIQDLKKEKLYLLADFDNFRKQSIKERSDLIKYGSEPIIREFISVLDDLERAAATDLTPETITNYKNGIEMIVSRFKKVLERFGVEEVEAQGQTFDPALHEALSSENNPDAPANSVTQVLKKAYKLKGKVIRPAQVVVNTAPTSKNKED